MHGCLWLIARATLPENSQQVYTCKIRIFKHIYALKSAHTCTVKAVLVREQKEAVASKGTVQDITSDVRVGLWGYI